MMRDITTLLTVMLIAFNSVITDASDNVLISFKHDLVKVQCPDESDKELIEIIDNMNYTIENLNKNKEKGFVDIFKKVFNLPVDQEISFTFVVSLQYHSLLERYSTIVIKELSTNNYIEIGLRSNNTISRMQFFNLNDEKGLTVWVSDKSMPTILQTMSKYKLLGWQYEWDETGKLKKQENVSVPRDIKFNK